MGNVINFTDERDKRNKQKEYEMEQIKEVACYQTYEYYAEYECTVCERPAYSFHNYCPFCGGQFDEDVNEVGFDKSDYLTSTIETLGLEALSVDTNIDKSVLIEIIQNKQPITKDIAEKLSDATGTTVALWLGL